MPGPQPPCDAASCDAASSTRLIDAACRLCARVGRLEFAAPVAHVYNPLDYAWAAHEAYLRRYGKGRKRVVFLGMNPGPFGMMQTGVPFGEVAAVRDWMGIEVPVRPPALQHPRRAIEGFACARSEVSGRRLWAWAAQRFGSADAFFSECFVLNYCPLVFLEASGRNRTPEQLPAAETAPLYEACDAHLREAIAACRPDWAIGIGGFAMRRLQQLFGAGEGIGTGAGEGTRAGAAGAIRLGQVLHPSPASPAANRGWAEAVDRALASMGVFG
jgi:single-strand selective monofunctional uracil DNA glycosylase